MARHFRPAPDPSPDAAPVAEPAAPALPVHLVATPAARGLARIGVGTLPFTIAAVMTLGALSTFVVLSPSSIPGLGAPDELAAVDDGQSVARPTRALDPDVTTTIAVPAASGAPAAASSAPTTARATTSAPRSSTSSAPSADGTGGGQASLVTVPVSTRTPTCDDFTLQPEAQAAFDADPTRLSGMDGDRDGLACEHLPGRAINQLPALSSRRIPITDQLRRPTTRLYGVHTPQSPYAASELDSFTAAAGGKAPNTVLFFQNLSQLYPATAVATSWARGMMPMISFEPIVQNSENGQPKLADITNGDWDDYFRVWAASAKEQGLPIALRFAQEMNGNWYSWSDGRFGNANGDFIAAWRHLHQLFDDVGADNVIWVWSVNRIDRLPDQSIARVYPGDEWVDWVGVSGYLRDVPDGVTPSFDFTYGRTLAALRAVAPSKLVMLTEIGAGTTEADRVTWIRSLFEGMLAHPEIIGFNWFNDFKDGGDWRIQYSDATSAAFAEGVADSRFGPLAPLLPE